MLVLADDAFTADGRPIAARIRKHPAPQSQQKPIGATASVLTPRGFRGRKKGVSTGTHRSPGQEPNAGRNQSKNTIQVSKPWRPGPDQTPNALSGVGEAELPESYGTLRRAERSIRLWRYIAKTEDKKWEKKRPVSRKVVDGKTGLPTGPKGRLRGRESRKVLSSRASTTILPHVRRLETKAIDLSGIRTAMATRKLARSGNPLRRRLRSQKIQNTDWVKLQRTQQTDALTADGDGFPVGEGLTKLELANSLY